MLIKLQLPYILCLMDKNTHNLVLFTKGLKKLMDKHGCYLLGNLDVISSESPHLDIQTHKCEIVDFVWVNVGVHRCRDMSGPFIVSSAELKEVESGFKSEKIKITVMDKDVLLRDGVKSPITQEAFHNRAGWKEHLKAHGCVEVGNDYNNAKPREEVRGDFNCREELGKATYQVMEKYGH
jgi:hypothetical protein